MIYTFYSFKGGVGRSMALANIAELLYQKGLKVLLIDFDLEAPGLDRYFDFIKLKNATDGILSKRGLIDLLLSYKDLSSLPSSNSIQVDKENSNKVDTFSSFVEPLSEFITPIYEINNNGGSLSIITAGRRSEKEFSKYSKAVRSFDWDDFYTNWRGEQFFEWFREQVDVLYDVVLIDSRTGITEMSGVCTHQLADTVVIFVASNIQNLDGVIRIAKSLKNPELLEKGRKGRRISLIFVPSRVEHSEAELLDEFAKQFKFMISPFIEEEIGFEKNTFGDLKIPYVSYYSFMENVAMREPERASASDLIRAFKNIAFAMAKFAPENSMVHEKIISEKVKTVFELFREERFRGEGSIILISNYNVSANGECYETFSGILADGLASGKADLNQDGFISITELVKYIDYETEKRNSDFKLKSLLREYSDFVLAENPKIDWKSNTFGILPKDIYEAINSPLPRIRQAAVKELEQYLLSINNDEQMLSFRTALKKLSKDKDNMVSNTAMKILERYEVHMPNSGLRAQRRALIIDNFEYMNEALRSIRYKKDIDYLCNVLADPKIGGFDLKYLTNQPSHRVKKEIDVLFSECKRGDSLLLYIFGQGVVDKDGQSYFATIDTSPQFVRSTAISTQFLKDVLEHSRSERKILILDMPLFFGFDLKKTR